MKIHKRNSVLFIIILSIASCGESMQQKADHQRKEMIAHICDPHFKRSYLKSSVHIRQYIDIRRSKIGGAVGNYSNNQNIQFWSSIYWVPKPVFYHEHSGPGYCGAWRGPVWYYGPQRCHWRTAEDLSGLYGRGFATTESNAKYIAQRNCENKKRVYEDGHDKIIIGDDCEEVMTQDCFSNY